MAIVLRPAVVGANEVKIPLNGRYIFKSTDTSIGIGNEQHRVNINVSQSFIIEHDGYIFLSSMGVDQIEYIQVGLFEKFSVESILAT